MDIGRLFKKLKKDFGELSEDENRKLEHWETMAKILGKFKQRDVDEYIFENLRQFRRAGGLSHISEK